MTRLRKISLGELQLIEASAGTGKTHTITNLYVQLLLGIGCERSFKVDELLVLTFTRAAAQELRRRVTERIQAAQRAFQKNDGGKDDDLNELLAKSTDQDRDRKLLTAAIQLMDEAAIFTIHSFCARVLSDQSFETGTLFDQQLDDSVNGDQVRILKLASEDCFRSDLLSLGPSIRNIALSNWATPSALAKALNTLLYRGRLTLLPPFQPLEFDIEAVNEKIQQAKAGWLEDDLASVITQCNLTKNSVPMNRLIKMTSYCQSPDIDLQSEHWKTYSKSSLEEAMKKASSRPEHPVLNLIDDIHREADKISQIKINLWHEMIDKVRDRIRRTREEEQLITLSDLLTNLADALTRKGSTLGDTLAARWPVAMVDEYQDTDDIQSRIFEHIYHRKDSQNQPTLMMIGDPKQAIYQFRGADVYTYLNARRLAANTSANEPPPLIHNWRSTKDMVNANNYLFQLPGAFGSEDEITFTKARPADHGRTALFIDGKPQTPYKVFCPGSKDSPLSADQAREAGMEYAAEETARLLQGAKHGSVLVDDKPLKAGEIAFLIRSHAEAPFAKKALEKRGIHSVYLTKNSVLQQDTAKDLTLILQAVAEPTNYRAIRAALGTKLMQCNSAEIDRLNHDLALEQKVAQEFWQYHDTWVKKNVGAMINDLLITRKLGEKWLPLPDGKRQLTDLRHLTEVLQSGAATAPGCHQLLAWFVREQQQAAAETTDMDQYQIRLESDENLVKIVTMHSAKGLEYDLVMIPYPPLPNSGKKSPVLFHKEKDHRYQVFVELGDDPNNRKQAEYEERNEAMRLCYVAMTRAKYRCYLGAPTFAQKSQANKLTDSPFGQLMRLQTETNNEREIIDILREKLPEDLFEVVPLDKESLGITRLPADINQEQLQPALPLPEDIAERDRWRMHSYSRIVHSRSKHIKKIAPDTSADTGSLQPSVKRAASDENLVDDGADMTSHKGGYLDDELQEDEIQTPSDQPSRFTFPVGARIGVALHYLLEHADFQDESQHAKLCQQTLDRIGIEQNKTSWSGLLQEWLQDILRTPLNDDIAFSLSSLTDTDRLNELEFHFPVACRGGITALLKSNQYPGARALPDDIYLEGMMTGFIDLVFRHDGKYYLADYKSNHLGYAFAAYTNQALEEAIMVARYDLQYLIYTLALNRFLKFRLADYNYERDFGGVFYLFLRGMDGKSNGSGIYFNKPEAALIQQLDGLMGGGS